MDAGTLVTILFILLALAWGFWLIFKRDLMSVNLGKLISYFAGVIITLLIILWMVTRFLPWWGINLIESLQASPNIDNLQVVARNLWSDATAFNSGNVVVETTPQPQQPIVVQPVNPTPVPTIDVSPQSANPATAPQVQTGEQLYTVQRGDTLYSISRRFGISVNSIRARNNLANDNIRAEQVLVIPVE